MITALKRTIPKGLLLYIEPGYRRMRRWSAKLDRLVDTRTMDEATFTKLLERLGVCPGGTVMVHSSADEIARRVPGMNPMKLIRLLQELLGSEGTLLMPTFPFAGRQREYVETHDSFDVMRTASQVGLITEVFRRMPDVMRSLHPTHSVAGWGRHARELLSEHHLGTAFGEKSPIFKLRHYDGRVISLGAAFSDSFTILHVAEELHPVTRERAYEKQTRCMNIINGGETIRYEFRAMRGDVERNFSRVEKVFLRDGTLTSINERGLKCLSAGAERFITRSLELIDKGMYLF